MGETNNEKMNDIRERGQKLLESWYSQLIEEEIRNDEDNLVNSSESKMRKMWQNGEHGTNG